MLTFLLWTRSSVGLVLEFEMWRHFGTKQKSKSFTLCHCVWLCLNFLKLWNLKLLKFLDILSTCAISFIADLFKLPRTLFASIKTFSFYRSCCYSWATSFATLGPLGYHTVNWNETIMKSIAVMKVVNTKLIQVVST